MRLNKTYHISWYLEKEWNWNPLHFQVLTLNGTKRVQVAIAFLSKRSFVNYIYVSGKSKKVKTSTPVMEVVIIADGIMHLNDENINKDVLKDIDAHMIHNPYDTIEYKMNKSLEVMPPAWRTEISKHGWQEPYDIDWLSWRHTRRNNARSQVADIHQRSRRNFY